MLVVVVVNFLACYNCSPAAVAVTAIIVASILLMFFVVIIFAGVALLSQLTNKSGWSGETTPQRTPLQLNKNDKQFQTLFRQPFTQYTYSHTHSHASPLPPPAVLLPCQNFHSVLVACTSATTARTCLHTCEWHFQCVQMVWLSVSASASVHFCFGI